MKYCLAQSRTSEPQYSLGALQSSYNSCGCIVLCLFTRLFLPLPPEWRWVGWEWEVGLHMDIKKPLSGSDFFTCALLFMHEELHASHPQFIVSWDYFLQLVEFFSIVNCGGVKWYSQCVQVVDCFFSHRVTV